MQTKVLTKVDVEREPRKKGFVGRQNILAGERALFLGNQNEFDAFKELMRTTPVRWEERKVHKRSQRRKGKPLIWEVKIKGKKKTKEIYANQKPDIDKINIKDLDKEKGVQPQMKKVLLPKKGKGRRWGLTQKIRSGRKVMKTVVDRKTGELKEVVAKERPPFLCWEDQPLQIRVMGNLDDVRDMTIAIQDKINGKSHEQCFGWLTDIKEKLVDVNQGIARGNAQKTLFGKTKDVFDLVTGAQKTLNKERTLPWNVGFSDIGLTKMFVDKKNRTNGKFCSDTIRSYINPEPAEDFEEFEVE